VQVGGRESRITQTFMQTEIGPLLVPIIYNVNSPFVFPETEVKNSVFTYMVTPEYKITPDILAYTRFASGFRAGGINVSQGVGTPIQYNPDRTYNYELGLKADFLEHHLIVDASLYYIDWKNLQINLTSPVDKANYLANGSEAKSEGIELAVRARPLTGLTLDGWIDYDGAALTQDFPADSTAYGVKGNRLPFNARWTGHVSAQQDVPLGHGVTGYLGAQATYVGERLGVFTPTTDRQVYPTYTQTDLRAGANWDTWSMNVYANNITDKRGEIGGGIGSFSTTNFYYIQPRTVGLSLSKTF
jgi:iron complex outermembrane receptor protein